MTNYIEAVMEEIGSGLRDKIYCHPNSGIEVYRITTQISTGKVVQRSTNYQRYQINIGLYRETGKVEFAVSQRGRIYDDREVEQHLD